MSNATASLQFSAAAARRRAFRAAVVRALRQMWTSLELVGQRRAQRELARFVEIHGDRYPELRAQVRARSGQKASA